MRTIVFDIVFGTLEEEKHSDDLFHSLVECKNGKRALSGQEKNFIRRVSYGTVERMLELDFVLNYFSRTPAERMKPVIRTILRMGVYELLYMDAIPAAATCNEMVQLAKSKNFQGLSGFVNGILRNVAREDPEKLKKTLLAELRTEEKKLSFLFSMPENLVQMLLRSYGKKTTKKILASFYEERPVTIRVHTCNASKEQVRHELESAGVTVTDGAYMKNSLCIQGFDRIDRLPGFSEGHFTVQDESSMLPALAAGIKPGDVIVDVCSSPGGKAFHALDLLKGSGMVSARDVSEGKIRRIRENAQRLRAENIEIKIWDAAVPDEEWRERADVVLADVPCSGIGVIGKKPEIKYHAMESAANLPDLQRAIVTGAVAALKSGGTLIYSTCTINPKENEEMAAWIRENHDLEPVSLDDCLPEALRNGMTAQGMLQILPGVQKGDGFFVAKFRKK